MTLKPTGIPDDAELIRRARQQDERAFRLLVKRHEQMVRGTILGMLGDADGTDDLAQEVFIRFYRKIDEFRGDAKLSTYLTRIAINLTLNELKRRKRRRRWMNVWGGDEAPPPVPDPSANPGRFETRELLQQALQQLEPEFRSVIVLRLVDGYSVKETAEILQLPQGTVASRLARGQEKLKTILRRWL